MTIILDQILNATSRTELFGSGTNGSMRQAYLKLARQSHPDMFSNPADKTHAEKAFKHLTHLWQDTPDAKPAKSSLITTKKHSYDLGSKFHEDDIFMAYNASYDAGYEKCELWITRNPQDNDLGQNAGSALKTLGKKVPEEFRAFYPEFVELFKYRQGGVDHATIVQKVPVGFVSLAKVKEAYPHGIHGRDAAWMFKRMLVAIGNAYDAGLVHGGISHDAFLIHPELHGLILRNWQYSAAPGEALTAIDATVKNYYPESVFDKKPQSYALDVRMAAKVMQDLMEDKAPKQLRIFLSGCTVTSMPHPAQLLAEFDELLIRVYGSPKFHVFTMP